MSDDPLEQLAKLLARLPGIGAKTGLRLAHHLFHAPERYREDLGRALLDLADQVKTCDLCSRPSTSNPCAICADPERDQGLMMVLEDALDLAAIEKTGAFRGVYHLLGGAISPLAGRGPDKLNIPMLLERLRSGQVREVIVATNPSAEGDATANYLDELIAAEAPAVVRTRPARGLPVGAEIRYLDPHSLEAALKGRRGC